MYILLFYLFSFVSVGTPLAGCSQNGNGAHVYTLSRHSPNLDSVNGTITGGRRNAITVAVAKASPAVVGINVTAIEERQLWNPFADDPFFRQFFGGNRTEKYQVKALGSGFIISPDGYILTNDHVAGNATKIIVTTTDGSQYDAKLVGTDRNSDVSLLKIDGKRLPYLKLGNSDDLAVGEWAIAMGNPFGLFSINDKPTVTVGVVSNTGVNLGLEDGRNYRDMIQTDAAISSGNSGGPLLDANGDVIGMNSVIRSTAQSEEGAGSIGLGFAIPINRVKTVVDELRSGEKINHNIGDLGMNFQDVNDQMRDYFKLTSDVGVVVTQIERDGVAARAGIQPGDLIVGFDSEKIRGSGELQSALADHLVGDEVTFRIERDGRNVNVRIQLPAK
ncbi:MAG: S1C family serine protease [Candidatus Kapaibacterium sp.]